MSSPIARVSRLVAVCLLLAPNVLGADPVPGAPRRVLLLRVTTADPGRDLPALFAMDLDVAGMDTKTRTVDVLGDAATVQRLRDLGFAVDVRADVSATSESVEALSDYLSPAEIEQRLDQYVAAYPSLARKESYATTSEGRPVWALEISDNVSEDEDEPAILFVSQHHAREVMTPEIVVDIADWLLTRYGTDPDVTRWVDSYEIWVLPSHNPDGSNWVFTSDNNWRKNRRVNGGGSYGVDPNRNYPFRWNACGGSSGDPNSETYRGPAPASEPETYQGITELARRERPVIALSYHTYGELVIMPYGCTGSHTPENKVFRDITSDMAVRLISDTGTSWYQPGSAWETLYAVDGEMNDWFYGELGTYSVTIEANTSSQGFQPDYATWRDATVQRNRPGWQYLLDRLEGPSIRGRVTDACTGSPLAATVGLDEVVFSNGETPRTATPQHGFFQMLTAPGTFTVRTGLAGYVEQVWPVQVDRGVVDRAVRLVPAGSFGLAARATTVADAGGDADGQADPGESVQLGVRLLNTGGALSGVTAALATSDPWVTIVDPTATYGSIAPGAEADGDGFAVQVDPTAPDGHVATFTLSFAADQTLCASSDTVAVRLTTGAPSCPFAAETLDVDPGWTIANTGSGGWQFGPPAGNGGSTGPAAAHTGTSVYGTNLTGSYGSSGDFKLTTGAWDLRGLRASELRFWRWLDVEAGYDVASVEISSDAGVNWTEIWSGFAWGEGWQLQRVDISPWADQEQDVRFRFRLRSDVNTERAGFYVDDVSVCGEAVPSSAGKLRYESHRIEDAGADYANGNGALDAGETVTLPITIRSNRIVPATGVQAFLRTTTPGVTIRNGWTAFPDVAPGSTAESSAPHFTLTVDGASCRKTIAFELDVRWDGGQATSTFALRVGTERVVTLLDDEFEADQGWTTGGLATRGLWVREDPYGVVDSLGRPVQPEDDTTPSPGVACWVTGNPRPRGNFDPSSGDVDGGTVWLQSPAFDGLDADSLPLTANRWFTRKNPGTLDQSAFRIRVSRDDGASWTTVEALTADAAAWTPVSYDLTSFVTPSTTMRLRVEVQESLAAGDTLLEGLIDDVRLDRRRYECDPFTPPARVAPNGVGASLRASKSGGQLRLDWIAPPTDGAHDPATSYRVYRSGSPSGGFALVQRPTAPFDVPPDELVPGGPAFFVIVAENGGGTSDDQPAP